MATAAAALLTVIALPATAAAAQTSVCRDVKVPVTLVPGTPADQTIYRQLCSPAGGPSKVLQVLVHGVTYDHHYGGVNLAAVDGHLCRAGFFKGAPEESWRRGQA